MQDTSWFAHGGQKLVARGTLSGASAVAKIVPLPVGPNLERVLKRARREVEFLSAVDSTHVVSVLTDAIEIGDQPDYVCWAEEYLEGVDVGSLLAATPWSDEDVWRLLTDIAQALTACHELEVVHRDLSSGNVRKTTDGRYVLMDPGLARHLLKTGITGHAQPGTDGWRSPEHVPGGQPVPSSDIFSLGLLSFYALTGKFAFDPDSPNYAVELSSTQAPSIQSVSPGVNAELAAVVDRCLQRQAARRYIDGSELAADLSSREFGK